MKIKVDENLPGSVAALLRDRGIDADSVNEEGLSGTPDPDLLRVASDDDRMIFTLDRGFGDVREYPPGTHHGIVVFRLEGESAPAATAAVIQLIDNHHVEDLRGAITVVQHGTHRIRRPE